ncbi:DUF488 family protein [Kocuria tytonicola]|nr:DUF488 family protein [Kocuria tytonicola]
MYVVVKRIYDEPAQSAGTRVLVDRVRPRGIRKAADISQAAVLQKILSG